MSTTRTDATVPATVRPDLAQPRVKESTLRRVSQLAAAVVLLAAGVVVGFYVPELSAALLLAGVQTGVGAITDGHDERRHGRAAPGMALA